MLLASVFNNAYLFAIAILPDFFLIRFSILNRTNFGSIEYILAKKLIAFLYFENIVLPFIYLMSPITYSTPSNPDYALTFDEAVDRAYLVLGRNRYHHVNMVEHDMPSSIRISFCYANSWKI